jgi:hypothetical protein
MSTLYTILVILCAWLWLGVLAAIAGSRFQRRLPREPKP